MLQTTVRVLSVLRAIGQNPDATITELHRICGLPRPTLYRIVETLCITGYVQRQRDRTYRLTFRVRDLSDGFSDEEWVRDISAPILNDLRKKVIWPTELATFENNAMILRETTRRDSPLTIDRGTTGLRLPMLETAHGRCYLAFSPKPVQQQIIANLVRSGAAPETLPTLESDFEHVRQHGYACRYRGTVKETGSIAVPILQPDRVLGSIAITFMAAALTPEEAVKRLLGDLKEAARHITAKLTECPAAVPGADAEFRSADLSYQ
jgi:IclR family mhp operon transcriptional activator